MKKNILNFFAAALLLASCNNAGKDEKTKTDTANATKTEVKADKPATPMDSAAMNKAWQEFMTPGAMHKWMEKSNGTWEAEVSTWMSADAPPTKSKATNVQHSALGGRYVISNFSSNMMGSPLEGIATMGYDNGKKMFVSTWVDNMGTGIIYMTGTYDSVTKTLHMKGLQTDPFTGKDTDIREELTMIDDNTYSQVMYGAGLDGKEMKFMEGTFKKKK